MGNLKKILFKKTIFVEIKIELNKFIHKLTYIRKT